MMIKNICQRAYFVISELQCKCGCGTCNINPTFLKKLIKFRVIYGIPFIPRSVYRCKNHPGYSTNHDSHAVDVPYEKENSNQRMKIIKAGILSDFNRIGISEDFVHLDDNPEYNGTLNEEVLWIYPCKWEKGKK